MNREVKFRAWDGKVMHYQFLVGRPQAANCLSIMTNEEFAKNTYKLQEWKLMESTGIKDKYGVEIYEGDIIVRDGRYVEYVSWDRGSFHTYIYAHYKENKVVRETFHHQHKAQIYDNLKYWKEQGVVVIGNIHENPELSP